MSRVFVKITSDELKDKINHTLYENEYLPLNEITPIVSKDLSKVNFDTENITDEGYTFGPVQLLGYQVLPNGMSFCGVCAGGDWEVPVFFIIYWDGSKFRGYIPEKGNLWNTDTKQAYGNDDEADLKNAKKRWPEYFANIDLNNFDSSCIDGYDVDAMKKDIMERIVEKPLTKPKKRSNVEELPVYKPLKDFTNEELLAELGRRLKGENNGK